MPLSPVELRHKLHQTPELMFNEFETTRLIEENLSKLNNLRIHRPLDTELVAEYKVNDGPYLLFRADIDALPVKEDTGVEFASKNDCMHACGHDVHTSILYGFAEYVTTNKIDRNILFLFQPGEEGGGGAERVIKSGIFDNYKITNAFALHVTDEYDKGTIATTSGVLFASAYEIDIEIFGKSAHVAFPENGINSFDALRLFFDEAQEMLNEQIKQKKERIIFGYGRVVSGKVRNIIPAYSKAECTIRTLSSRRSEEFLEHLTAVLEGVKKKTGVTYNISNGSLYSEVCVDGKMFIELKKPLSEKYNFIDCGYKMTGEDFGFFSKLYPSFMFWLGTSSGEHYGLHTPKFLPDDSVIQTGINIYKDILQEVK
ncbi:MAG: amidohydrolase [Bacillota bacterium]